MLGQVIDNLTLAHRLLSTPVTIVLTLSPCISNQLEAFVTLVVTSVSRLITSHFYYTAIWWVIEGWTGNSCTNNNIENDV